MVEELLVFLNKYASVSSENFTGLMDRLVMRNFEKKAILTKTGEVEEHMYFILSGLTRKFFTRGKNEIITHIVKEGGIIGSAASFFSGTPSKYTIEALEPTSALSISRQNLEDLFSSGKAWEKTGRLMTAHYFLVQETRMLDNTRYTTKERFLKFVNENPDLLQRVSQKHLAAYLNIKPETFSRLKHLVKGKK